MELLPMVGEVIPTIAEVVKGILVAAGLCVLIHWLLWSHRDPDLFPPTTTEEDSPLER